MKQGKSILKSKFIENVKYEVCSIKNKYVDNFYLFCWSISTFLQHDKAILTKKMFFGVKPLSGAIFAGVWSQFCWGSEPSPVGFPATLQGSE